MSKAVMKQALSAFEAIMFEKDVDSCQIIARNARYALREELAKPEHPLDKKADNARELGLNYEPEHGFDRTASHMAGEYVDTAEQEPILSEKDGSPCPEFWDWLPKAYNFEGNGTFTKYNMEVAFLAGKNYALAQPEPDVSTKQQNVNTSEKRVQISDKSIHEPVAWITRRTGDGGVVISGYETCEPTDYDAIPIYTAPPKREWQGLTDEEIDWIFGLAYADDMELLKTIEAKLREKNT